jgi:hypothetical protein
LNLRINPFGDLSSGERANLAIIDFDLNGYIGRLRKPGYALQFIGPSGRGKSTHLFAIRGCFPDLPYTYIPVGEPVPEIPDTPVQFIDEMQRIPRSSRAAILKRQASFVIGSHKNHGREFEKAGLEYEVVRLGGITRERLISIINNRIEWAHRDPNRPVPRLSEEAVANLIATYGDDVWAIENHLYEVFQEMKHVGEVTVRPPTAGMKLKKQLNATLTLFDGVI